MNNPNRLQVDCNHCKQQVDRIVYINVYSAICEDCLNELLDKIGTVTPVCVKHLLSFQHWEVQTVDGVKNVLVDTRSDTNKPQPDYHIRLGKYVVPVYGGEVKAFP